ncbi:hypothetical protein QQP08_017476 [Theobroma cacao]|nr:hypothetical protein QQP08_017476 [Theobroma cacao]
MDCGDTRCSPFLFYKLLENMGSEYNDSIRSMGLGGFTHLQEYKLNKDLCLWLIEIVHLNKRCLKLYDYEIPLTSETVSIIIGLSVEGTPITFIVFLDHISGARFNSKYGQYFLPRIATWNQEKIHGWLTRIKDFKNPKNVQAYIITPTMDMKLEGKLSFDAHLSSQIKNICKCVDNKEELKTEIKSLKYEIEKLKRLLEYNKNNQKLKEKEKQQEYESSKCEIEKLKGFEGDKECLLDAASFVPTLVNKKHLPYQISNVKEKVHKNTIKKSKSKGYRFFIYRSFMVVKLGFGSHILKSFLKEFYLLVKKPVGKLLFPMMFHDSKCVEELDRSLLLAYLVKHPNNKNRSVVMNAIHNGLHNKNIDYDATRTYEKT